MKSTTNRPHPARLGNITHRDAFIIAQALYWFVRSQQALPQEQFEWSNCEDAKLILLTAFPSVVSSTFAEADKFWSREPAKLELEKYDATLPAILRSGADNVVTLQK